jgi:PLP dependent protein
VSYITSNVRRILAELPVGVELVAVAKGREPAEVQEAIDAGARTIGENYLQEAEKSREIIGDRVQWHFIGHLQRNKVKKAVSLCDMIETLDSLALARDIEAHCLENGKTMPVLIEVNIGRESQKWGLLPEKVKGTIEEISQLPHVRIMGLMTMGPRVGNPEEARPYFVTTRRLFDEMKASRLPNVEIRYLSMGMSNSYRIAIKEGANIVRIGRQVFERS